MRQGVPRHRHDDPLAWRPAEARSNVPPAGALRVTVTTAPPLRS
ncbi:MAG: hypothetical protein OXG81_09520 [Acidobacteria bacterium]|nr:hypothetical protein [Acidobacteriota bacterium]